MLPSLEALASLDRETITKWVLLESILHGSPLRSRAVGSLRASEERDWEQHGNISADLSGKFQCPSQLSQQSSVFRFAVALMR